jgi:hypothetical protein
MIFSVNCAGLPSFFRTSPLMLPLELISSGSFCAMTV